MFPAMSSGKIDSTNLGRPSLSRGEPSDSSLLNCLGDMADIPGDLKETLLGKKEGCDLGETEVAEERQGSAAPNHASQDEKWAS